MHADNLKPYEGIIPPDNWVQDLTPLEDTELSFDRVENELINEDEPSSP